MKYTLEQIKAALVKAWKAEGDLCFQYNWYDDDGNEFLIPSDWEVFMYHLENPKEGRVMSDRKKELERVTGDLEQNLKDAIEDEGFSVFEWEGFKSNPTLALMAGAAIGYKMCLADVKPKMEFTLNKMDELLGSNKGG